MLVIETLLKEGSQQNAKLHEKLAENRQSLYNDVSWADLRIRSDQQYKSSPLGEFKHFQKDIIHFEKEKISRLYNGTRCLKKTVTVLFKYKKLLSYSNFLFTAHDQNS